MGSIKLYYNQINTFQVHPIEYRVTFISSEGFVYRFEHLRWFLICVSCALYIISRPAVAGFLCVCLDVCCCCAVVSYWKPSRLCAWQHQMVYISHTIWLPLVYTESVHHHCVRIRKSLSVHLWSIAFECYLCKVNNLKACGGGVCPSHRMFHLWLYWT